ncbi:MAG: N-acetyl-1-D-myo-inositol-2-amino-2-deoxy-alpha-D-glucopyranoside deacetylase [Candidatus Nanopelagicaceae bacterium]|nr:N-acetyl-1-D-myo-inositol-2-amino-2-deoxy-alpha-D-glucopyranoside deacetylase [Candidatus Nanopelagicaceae bacterium]
MRVKAEKRLLLVHAHPDDETINNGVTMAKYAVEGVHVTLVTCTRGEEGEVLVDSLKNLASDKDDKLGDHREIELKDAMIELGISDFRFLGSPNKKWRDSGMLGAPQNERNDVFWQSDLDEAANELVKVILEIKPQVMITYDEFGGYGHPDHIKAHRVAMRAAEISANQGWLITKIYWNTMPRSVLQTSMDKMKEMGSEFFGAESVDELPFAKADELVTSVVKAQEYVPQKLAAMKAHVTQISVDGPFFVLSNNLGLSVWADEYYTLVKGEISPPFDENGRELDIFAGVK